MTDPTPQQALWRDYLELCKPKVVALLMMTAVIGMLLATPGMVPWQALVFGNLGIALCAASAAARQWEAARAFDGRIQAMLQEILRQGREAEEFERKTPLDEAAAAIHLVLRPYLNPLLLQYSLDSVDEAPARLSSLVLRSLSP